ncbi:hypothetical protein GCM10022223_46690 [Kineosporia mesophila]|uniref:Uncharacterized protein n=1 Tax=Kineosporia mesophila TaxID=566012 RepID=A0ABP7A3K2_9ACTN|nr:hypothetical protein [Kineosporia mesophila]MCD5353780.1 hypothetical protein [Kineosporia mesophila]
MSTQNNWSRQGLTTRTGPQSSAEASAEPEESRAPAQDQSSAVYRDVTGRPIPLADGWEPPEGERPRDNAHQRWAGAAASFGEDSSSLFAADTRQTATEYQPPVSYPATAGGSAFFSGARQAASEQQAARWDSPRPQAPSAPSAPVQSAPEQQSPVPSAPQFEPTVRAPERPRQFEQLQPVEPRRVVEQPREFDQPTVRHPEPQQPAAWSSPQPGQSGPQPQFQQPAAWQSGQSGQSEQSGSQPEVQQPAAWQSGQPESQPEFQRAASWQSGSQAEVPQPAAWQSGQPESQAEVQRAASWQSGSQTEVPQPAAWQSGQPESQAEVQQPASWQSGSQAEVSQPAAWQSGRSGSQPEFQQPEAWRSESQPTQQPAAHPEQYPGQYGQNEYGQNQYPQAEYQRPATDGMDRIEYATPYQDPEYPQTAPAGFQQPEWASFEDYQTGSQPPVTDDAPGWQQVQPSPPLNGYATPGVDEYQPPSGEIRQSPPASGEMGWGAPVQRARPEEADESRGRGSFETQNKAVRPWDDPETGSPDSQNRAPKSRDPKEWDERFWDEGGPRLLGGPGPAFPGNRDKAWQPGGPQRGGSGSRTPMRRVVLLVVLIIAALAVGRFVMEAGKDNPDYVPLFQRGGSVDRPVELRHAEVTAMSVGGLSDLTAGYDQANYRSPGVFVTVR